MEDIEATTSIPQGTEFTCVSHGEWNSYGQDGGGGHWNTLLASEDDEREREREIDYWRLFRESTWDNSISHPWGHPQSSSNILSPVVVSSVETKTPFPIIPRALHG
ncbi:hypothetical protein NC653_008613 [Populus alba x Populus x berolinensis]|uniref:Uncharacterized protein n=1 Tax=Populus alba x Populus x berolinensis TaxID=444605 RepID=A0AAD6W8R2_9ROSI|nr:hypothetical protein NC653_008613 [Populus alba x Populus x berolinensis]